MKRRFIFFARSFRKLCCFYTLFAKVRFRSIFEKSSNPLGIRITVYVRKATINAKPVFYKKLLTKQAEVDIILNVAVEQQLITF